MGSDDWQCSDQPVLDGGPAMIDDETRKLERLCRPIDHRKIRIHRAHENGPLWVMWVRHGRPEQEPPYRRPYRGRGS